MMFRSDFFFKTLQLFSFAHLYTISLKVIWVQVTYFASYGKSIIGILASTVKYMLRLPQILKLFYCLFIVTITFTVRQKTSNFVLLQLLNP